MNHGTLFMNIETTFMNIKSMFIYIESMFMNILREKWEWKRILRVEDWVVVQMVRSPMLNPNFLLHIAGLFPCLRAGF